MPTPSRRIPRDIRNFYGFGWGFVLKVSLTAWIVLLFSVLLDIPTLITIVVLGSAVFAIGWFRARASERRD